MTVELISSNPPESVEAARMFYAELRGCGGHYYHGAESLQLNEQEEANGIAAFVADRILTFIAGIAVCLVSEIVILLIVKGVPWS